MLWRLNQELLPDPGSPIARTTTPLLARGAETGAAGTEAGCASAGAALAGAAACWAGRLLPRPPLRRRRGRRMPPADCAVLGSVGSSDDAGSGKGLLWGIGASGAASLAADFSGSGSGSKYAGCSGAGFGAESSCVFFRRLNLSRIHLRMLGL